MVHDNCSRIKWKLAVIESLIRDSDGMVRLPNIRMKNGVTNRPLTKLYPIEVTARK